MKQNAEEGGRALWADGYRFRQLAGGLFLVGLVVIARPAGPGFGVGLVLCALGEALRLWAAGYVRKSRVLETRGPYAFVRHPQYLGNTLIAVGLSLAAGRPWAILVWAGMFWLLYVPAIAREDAKLRRRFQEQWDEWGPKTPAVVPFRWPSGRSGLRVLEWSLPQSVRNGEPLWIGSVAAALGIIYWGVL